MPLARHGASGLLATALLLSSCGGDSTDPDEPFPDASGVYQVSGAFDELPSSQAFFNGTLELTQASQESGALHGSAAFLVDLSGDIFNVADDNLLGANVSPSGVVSFTMAGASTTWTFSGTLSGDNIAQGRHTLAGSGLDNISGIWQGTRSTASLVGRPTTGYVSLDELRSRLR